MHFLIRFYGDSVTRVSPFTKGVFCIEKQRP